MRDTPAEIGNLQIVIHNDDETPWEFAVEVIRSIFGRSDEDARCLSTVIERKGKAVCGTYPSPVAHAMVKTAQQRIKAAGHQLRITSELPGADEENTAASDTSRNGTFKYAYQAIAWHFAGLAPDEIVTTSRQFPGHMRADVQVALNKLFSNSPIRFFGLFEQHRYETL